MVNHIAYVVDRFPHLSETLVLREIDELERQGCPVDLYPLALGQADVVHAAAQPWLDRTVPLPWKTRKAAHAAVSTLRHEGRLWGRTIWEHRDELDTAAAALRVLLQAAHAAPRMVARGIRHIHAHHAGPPALFAWNIHRLTGLSYSVTVHDNDLPTRPVMLAAKLRDAAFVAVGCDYSRGEIGRMLGIGVLDKTYVIRSGVVGPGPRPSDPHTSHRRFEVVSVGSLEFHKGYQHLVDACSVLRDRGVPLHCSIIGSGRESGDLAAMIAEAKLDHLVDLLGPRSQEELAHIWAMADCYVQPGVVLPNGEQDGLPVALIEAMANGIPAVATRVGGVPEVVRNGETGYVVPPANPAALAAAMWHVYVTPCAARKTAAAGQALVLREWDLRTNVGNLAACFADTLARGAGGALAPVPVAEVA